ncbi:MAG: AAA family ATPase [Gemmatimonadaceae bacterium]
MHGTQDSLVYWLEFKDDEIFPGIFGSITGGSALKFGVYRRAETGTWAKKGTGPAPHDISLAEAIEIARRHRDQLLAAVDVVAAVPRDGSDDVYLDLQKQLERVARDIENTAWGHKYLSLLFPNVLDAFHVSDYQRYHLVRLLQLPPREGNDWASGRYVCAGRYVSVARKLEFSLHDLATLLNRRNGSPRKYWRVGTTDDEHTRKKYWFLMRDTGSIAIGWPKLGDLAGYQYDQKSKDSIAAMIRKHYPNTPQRIGRSANELLSFVARMSDGDRVVAADGQTVLGVGEISGQYRYDVPDGFPHKRPVIWRSLVEWGPMVEGLRTSVGKITKLEHQVEIERHILDDAATTRVRTPTRPAVVAEVSLKSRAHLGPLGSLSGVPGQLQAVLARKGQAILYGPPGTGKTHWALHTARELASLRAFGADFNSLQPDDRARVVGTTEEGAGLVSVTSFHPEYGYEDFIEGYRPALAPDESLTFRLTPGLFRRVCAAAASSRHLDFYLVIDEINRGDVPRIFGELLTLLEHNKRGETIILPASGETFSVPPNVYVIGTMNTADRSIALLDIALRRRFGFVELMPDYAVLKGASIDGLPLAEWLRDINARIRSTGGGDARNRQIGHAFLLTGGAPITTMEQFAAILRDDIVPLLEEYCYDDFGQIADIIGTKLVDTAAQRVRGELFEVGRGQELLSALARPEIATAAATIQAESTLEDDLPDEEDSEGDALEDGQDTVPQSTEMAPRGARN